MKRSVPSRNKRKYKGGRGDLKNKVYFDLVWNNNKVKTYDADVTSQLQANSHGGVITVWIDCAQLTPPEGGDDSGSGSLFIPMLEDYDEVQWNIEI